MKAVNLRTCTNCKTIGKIINSNNPLVVGVCEDCLQKAIDIHNIHQVQFFCRTYNIPFDPDAWMRISSQVPKEAFSTYAQIVADEHADNPNYTSIEAPNAIWDEVQSMWEKKLTHENLLTELSAIKDDWLAQMAAKWGATYTFTEYLKLENLYNNTIQATGATNVLTINLISKIATVSVLMDRALEDGEIKMAGEYSKMLRDQIKMAGLDDSVDIAQGDVINTVADLCNYLEQKGFQFEYYNNEKRDIVDMTIADIKEWTVNFVRDATGLQQTYTLIEDAYKSSLEQKETDKATSEVSLEDIIENKKQAMADEIDNELDAEEWGLDDDIEIN